jgi:heme O synthase-like polyprenyltransferase
MRDQDNKSLPIQMFKYSITYLAILFAALLVDHYMLIQISF